MSAPNRSVFWRGVRDSLPFLFVVGPFALLFGVVATEAGLGLVEVMGFSVLVIAGAAQFAALQQLAENAPVIVVLATALAVNLRMAMYSAALVPHLGEAPLWQRALIAYLNFDQTFAQGLATYEREPDMPTRDKVRYFLGVATPTALGWYGMTLVGALVGQSIPADLGLDFALPITFIALVAPMLRTAAHIIAAAVSVAAALTLGFLPYNLGLLAAGVLAMMAGARAELWLERRRA